MKHSKYYVCPVCGNFVLSTGDAEISCCGKKLMPLETQKAEENEKLCVQTIEDEWFITSDHPMEKGHYLSFLVFATGDKIQIIKQYPEWQLQVRIPKHGFGTLYWYCTSHGLFYQLLR